MMSPELASGFVGGLPRLVSWDQIFRRPYR